MQTEQIELKSLPADPLNPRNAAVGSGFLTSEFVLTAVTVLVGAVMASGLVPSDGPWFKLLGVFATVLASLGYTASRTSVKNEAARGAAEIAKAEVQAASPNPAPEPQGVTTTTTTEQS